MATSSSHTLRWRGQTNLTQMNFDIETLGALDSKQMDSRWLVLGCIRDSAQSHVDVSMGVRTGVFICQQLDFQLVSLADYTM